jgi:hypothetical protein
MLPAETRQTVVPTRKDGEHAGALTWLVNYLAPEELEVGISKPVLLKNV